MKKFLSTFLKIAVSVALLAWLISMPENQEAFQRLVNQQPDWLPLGVAGVLVLSAVILTFIRWFWLVRTLGLPFTMSDAFRLGFLGFLLNFVSLGAVGGDVFKAFFLAKEQKGRRPEAVATVVLDRFIGLIALVLIAALATAAAGLYSYPEPEIRSMARIVIGAAVVIIGGIGVFLIPGFPPRSVINFLVNRPWLGPPMVRLLKGFQLYRRRPLVIVCCLLMGCGTHTLMALAMYMISIGLPGEAPGVLLHLVVSPLAMLAGALPLPGGGLGALELAMNTLYREVAHYQEGLIVAFVYRAITIIVAMIGLVYYLMGRKEIDRTMKEAEEAQEGSITKEPESGDDPQPAVKMTKQRSFKERILLRKEA
ncbi:Hypothetical protein PBC10988_29050 [Planctomycetales bacterium 10988]|nr:Hypothetical protein PBC10988_29050 [Planctomycetales bacterium 10988]